MTEIDIAENRSVIAYLRVGRPDTPLIANPDSVPNPFYQLGAHPDIVEHLWDKLGKSVAPDCRFIVCGIPALVQPESGVIFGLAIGTQYVLRLPNALNEAAQAAGAKNFTKWSNGTVLDVSMEFGPEWVFGCWSKCEADWCRSAYTIFSRTTG